MDLKKTIEFRESSVAIVSVRNDETVCKLRYLTFKSLTQPTNKYTHGQMISDKGA